MMTRRLRKLLVVTERTLRKDRIMRQTMENPFGKLQLVASTLHHQTYTLSTAMTYIDIPGHRAAVSAFVAGDFFLGRYAGNYFAKKLLPTNPRYASRLAAAELDGSRICLHCWSTSRSLFLEDEAHVLVECPLYRLQREDLQRELAESTRAPYKTKESKKEILALLLNTDRQQDWKGLGKFLARVRQLRRKMRRNMQHRCADYESRCFDSVKAHWKREGRHVCRHGVFFGAGFRAPCPCLSPASTADWSTAILMPALDTNLKCIVTDSFDRSEFMRLGLLQAELRRRQW